MQTLDLKLYNSEDLKLWHGRYKVLEKIHLKNTKNNNKNNNGIKLKIKNIYIFLHICIVKQPPWLDQQYMAY